MKRRTWLFLVLPVVLSAAISCRPAAATKTISFVGVQDGQSRYRSMGLNIGYAGYWFPQFHAGTAGGGVSDRPTHENDHSVVSPLSVRVARLPLLQKLTRALRASLGATFGNLLWYALLAGAASLLFYVLFPRFFRRRRIADADPSRQQVSREIFHSLRSLAIFGLVAAGVVVAALSGWTRIYINDDRYGWPWFITSIVLIILLHDAYFYWTHRLMHHPRLFRRMHHTHHLSTSPTPWAAYAFSPAEALVQAGIGPLIVFTIPTHPAAFGLFMLWQISFNVMGHCGHELFPRGFVTSPAGRLLNTTTHHALHHEKFRTNFGLYFNVWDRLIGTNHPEYEVRFDRAHGVMPATGADGDVGPKHLQVTQPQARTKR